MAKSGKKAAHALILAKKLVRLKRADGGETDPLMDSDYTSPPDKPNYVMSTEATKPVLTPDTFYERANSVLKERARDFGQGLSEMPGQAWEAIKYPVQALRGETSRAVDPNTGKIVDVSPSGMTGDEAAMVGAGLVSTGALPDIMAGKVTPNVMRAGAASDRAVNLAKAPRSDLGFYSHGAETAANLPQPKGTADQMISMLRNQGVKPAELENAGLITSEGAIHPDWAGKPVTREELSQHLQQSMPQVEETTLGGKEPFDAKKLEQLEKEYSSLSQHPVDDPTFGQEKYDELIRLMNIRDQSTTQSLYDAADQAVRSAQRAQSNGNKITAEKYFREAEFLNTRAEKLDLEGQGLSKPAQFSDYQLPGGDNYREVALTLPGDEVYRAPSVHSMGNEADVNRLAHIRMSDRAGPNGEKLLHVEELQSDWGQEGRKEGFVDPKDNMQDLVKEYDYLTKQRRALEVSVRNGDDADPATQAAVSRLNEVNNSMSALSDRMTAVRSNIPSAPYVTSTQGWTDLALKRVMKEAAEGGYDGVVFTPGAEQAKRYPNMEEKAAQGLQKFYDNFVTTRAKELARQHDKEANLGKAEIPNTKNITGFHMPMTDKMRQSILSGQKAFKKGGRINPASGNATKDEKMEQFGHKVKESKEINPLIDTALMLVSRKT